MMGRGWEVSVKRPGSRWRAHLAGWLLVAGLGSALALASETGQLIEALAVQPGMTVADVGAGDGEWTERLAERVGPTGRVIATEVDAAKVDEIGRRVDRSGLKNVTIVQGTQEDTGLPDGCCDAILLRMVYHHFTRPAEMRASLRRALRPGARLVVLDTEPQTGWSKLPGVPDRGGHGISERDLTREMTADGFEVVARYPDWNGNEDRYGVVFRTRDATPAESAAPPEP
jgi:predicted methyltransferase